MKISKCIGMLKLQQIAEVDIILLNEHIPFINDKHMHPNRKLARQVATSHSLMHVASACVWRHLYAHIIEDESPIPRMPFNTSENCSR